MPEIVDGKVVMKAPDGRLYRVAPEEVETVQRDLSWTPAGSEETAQRVAEREQYSRYGSTGQQALALGEQAVRTATFGLVPGSGAPKDITGREAVVREHSPVLSVGAQAVGALAPALLTGGAATGLAGAAGLGARGAGIVGAVGEGLVGGLADDVEQARFEARDVSAGNVLLFGLGGEIVGRALPKGLAMGAGRIKRAVTAVDEAAGEGISDAVAAAEARSVTSQARLARDLPRNSPERMEALKRTASEQYDRMATEAADDLDAITQMASKMGDTSSSRRVVDRLRETIAEPSPAQSQFFTATKEQLAQTQRALRKPMRAVDDEAAEAATESADITAAESAPVSLAGKSLRDLGAIDDPASLKPDTLEALRTGKGGRGDFAADFATTGRVREEGPFQGIQLEMGPSGKVVLRDGRNRLTVAREQGRETVYGQVYQGQRAPAKKPVYEGPIRIAEAKAQTAPGAPAAPGLAETPGLAGFAARYDQIVNTTLRRLDRTDDMVESYLIARQAKKQLQHLSKKMSLVKSPQDAVLHDEMRKMIDQSWRGMKDGLADKSLFGTAAEVEADINAAWSDKILRGLGISEQDLARRVDVDFETGRTLVEYDPAKARSFFQQDAIGRQIGQRKLEEVLSGAEEMAAAHARHGTWDTDEIAQLRQRVARVREKLALADELQEAKKWQAPESPAAKRGIMSHLGEIAVEEVVNKVPFGGLAMRAGKKLMRPEASGGATLSPGARRIREIIDRRRRESGAVFLPFHQRAIKVTDPASARNALAPNPAVDVPGALGAVEADDAATLAARAVFARHAGIVPQDGSINHVFRQVGPQGGKTPGGAFEGSDGVVRYVKIDKDPSHAAIEAGNTSMYSALGSPAPRLEVIDIGGTKATASDMLGPEWRELNEVEDWSKLPESVREAYAEQVPRDIIMGNWDVSRNSKNVMTDGKSIMMIDAGEAGANAWQAKWYKKNYPHTSAELRRTVSYGKDKHWSDWARADVVGSQESHNLLRGMASSPGRFSEIASRSLSRAEEVIERAGGVEGFIRKHQPTLSDADVATASAEMRVRIDELKKVIPVLGIMLGLAFASEASAQTSDESGGFMSEARRLVGLDGAGQQATRHTARNLAGVGAGYTERAFGGIGNAAPVPVATALSRFTGDYSGPEESFEAKRKLLDDEMLQPEVLYEVLGAALGDMPRVNEELFGAVATRLTQNIRYLRENMPVGIQVSMLYPNGTPPSRSAIRDWAVMWNTVMDPETVLEDITAGTATPLQMKTLREAHPDIYEQLRTHVVEEVGANFRDVPTSTKIQLDMLFQADGLAGPMFSSNAARMIGDAFRAQAEKKPPANRAASPTGPGAASAGPAGIESIQKSVTNAGAT